MGTKYPIGEVGPVREFLGATIDQNLDEGTMSMSQTRYLESLLTKFSKYRLRSTPIPMKLTGFFGQYQELCDQHDHRVYREIVGSLLYMSIWTRPNIAFSVSIWSRFLQRPAKIHLDLAFQVLGYLKWKPLPRFTFHQDRKLDIV